MSDADMERPWQALQTTITDPNRASTTCSIALVLALLALEVVRNVSHYEEPSEFLTPDAHLMELLRERRTRWIIAITPADQQRRRI